MTLSRGQSLKVISSYDIQEELVVCSYCMSEQGGKLSCCGEVHFEEAYVFQDEVYLKSEVVVLKPKKERQLCFTDMETSTETK